MTAEDFIRADRLEKAVSSVSNAHPELRPLVGAVDDDKPFMRQATALVTNLDKESRSAVLDALKSEIFEGLKAPHLRPEAITLVEEVRKLMVAAGHSSGADAKQE